MRKVLTIILIVVLVLGTVFLMPIALAFGRSGRETRVLGRDYSLLTKGEIIKKLENDFKNRETIELSEGKRNFVIETSSISAEIDTQKMVSNLLFRRLNQGIKRYFLAFFQKKDFDLEIKVDEGKFNDEINKISDQINVPFIPTELVLNKNEVVIKDGQLGKKIKNVELKNMVIMSLAQASNEKIEIPILTLGYLPLDSEKDEVINMAKQLKDKKLSLNWQGENTGVSGGELIGWLSFRDECNLEKISDYVSNLGKSVNKEASDALFKFENGKVTEFAASKDGFTIKKEELTSAICGKIIDWAQTKEKELTLEIPLLISQPSVTTNEVNNLGIKELLGRGISSFSHSSTIRNFNVEKGASIVNRVLVAPNETFSFLKNLGEVTLDNGYKKAYVIKKGKTELDVGGGICQVSTTLFRAMLDAGLNITARTAHAYRVSYYEEDSKPGFDATVFIPSPDLKFINDTGHHVLIQSIYDGKNKKLAYEIYGTSDGRKVEISNYRQWDAQPAPPDVWIDDPTLAPGKVVKDESKVPGLKASFQWKVVKGEEVLHQKTFTSSYVPWAAVYRKGPAQ